MLIFCVCGSAKYSFPSKPLVTASARLQTIFSRVSVVNQQERTINTDPFGVTATEISRSPIFPEIHSLLHACWSSSSGMADSTGC